MTTLKTVLQSRDPPELAFKIPASVIAPVPVPAAKDATYATAFAVTVVDVSPCLAASVPRAVSAAAAAVDP